MTATKLFYATVSLLILVACQIPDRAQNHQLIFTERSPKLLTATRDGSDYGKVVNTSPDHWTWESPHFDTTTAQEVDLDFPGLFSWQEPGGEPGRNYVSLISVTSGDSTFYAFDFVSDAPAFGNMVPDGTVGGSLSLMIDGTFAIEPSDIYFVDGIHEPSSVPDGGSAATLLIAGLAALSIARRKN